MNLKSELGKAGEDFACEYLADKNYKIIERNFRKSWGELDIITITPDKTLAFVEVKTMTGPAFGGLKPEDQMTRAKLKKFKRAASLYAGHRQELINNKKGWRLDLIAITKNGEDFNLEHYENVD
ncbi:MAG: YraN family protein [Patescibacteria group bacterium]|nr:YraN family protein [Patescibacteria group bacterium]